MTELPSPLTARGTSRGRLARRRAVALGTLLVVAGAIALVTLATLHVIHLRSTAPPPAPPPVVHHKGQTTASAPISVSRVGTLTTAVAYAAAEPLPGGGALIFGGLDSANTPLAAEQSFNGSHTGSGGTLPAPLSGERAALLGGSIYLFGGAGTSGPTGDIVTIASGGAGTIVSSLPQPTTDAASARVGDTAYIIGGSTGSADIASIVAYTPNVGSRTVASLPQPLEGAAGTAFNGEVYVIGGANGNATLNTIYRFDPASATVTKVASLPVGLTHAAAVVSGTRIVIVGGERTVAGDQTSSIFGFTPATRKVRQLGTLPAQLSGVATVSDPGGVLVLGGVSQNGQTNATIYQIRLTA